jgi:hypothetical protein
MKYTSNDPRFHERKKMEALVVNLISFSSSSSSSSSSIVTVLGGGPLPLPKLPSTVLGPQG